MSLSSASQPVLIKTVTGYCWSVTELCPRFLSPTVDVLLAVTCRQYIQLLEKNDFKVGYNTREDKSEVFVDFELKVLSGRETDGESKF